VGDHDLTERLIPGAVCAGYGNDIAAAQRGPEDGGNTMPAKSRFSGYSAAADASSYPAWIESPKLTVQVEHGTGKSVVSGPIEIVFNGPDTVYLSTDAHHNDTQPALRFRDRDWLASAHLTRAADGSWSETDKHSRYGITERAADWNKTTPATFRAAIIDALCVAAAAHWTPELARQAAYARAIQSLGSARRTQEEARAALAEANAAVDALERDADANAPDGVDPLGTWTFMGHWEGEEIIVEHSVPGVVDDPRIDNGYWPEGLWASHGSGRTLEEAQAAAVAEYEETAR
jgi:hypothetical protein